MEDEEKKPSVDTAETWKQSVLLGREFGKKKEKRFVTLVMTVVEVFVPIGDSPAHEIVDYKMRSLPGEHLKRTEVCTSEVSLAEAPVRRKLLVTNLKNPARKPDFLSLLYGGATR